MSDDLEPLPNDVLEALGQERRRPGLTDEAQARLTTRIAAALPTAPTAAPDPTPGPGNAGIAGSAMGKLGPALFVLGAVTGGVVGGTAVWLRTRNVEPTVIERVVRVEVPVPVPAPVAEVTEAPEPPPGIAARPPVKPAAKPAVEKPSAHQPSRDEQLAAERALVEAARVALTRGRVDEALSSLERHEREFADGRLAEERESLAVQALLARGDTPGARRRADQFRQRFPTSLLRPLIDSLVP